ncbi:MAG: UDP-N-acetylmuramate--L-alanine ligase, partial [Elusimicrobia bacterium CG11_big_fil_rev_8_21_14_0_20_64_6]
KKHLVEGIKAHGHRDVHALAEKTDLARKVASLAEDGDYVICMGAGDITTLAHALPEQLEQECAKAKGQVA